MPHPRLTHLAANSQLQIIQTLLPLLPFQKPPDLESSQSLSLLAPAPKSPSTLLPCNSQPTPLSHLAHRSSNLKNASPIFMSRQHHYCSTVRLDLSRSCATIPFVLRILACHHAPLRISPDSESSYVVRMSKVKATAE
jgi:hypothetical protein